MPHRHGSSLTNPLLGLYFGIFGACLAASVVLLLIFEQLGVTDRALRIAMAAVPVCLFASIGIGAYASRPADFLTASRRVPAVYNGLALTVAALGGAGLAGMTGGLFLIGFDMLFLGLGIVAGLAAMVMLIAPFVRKFGAPTIPGYLGQRFESGGVRLLAASIAVVPLMLLMVAEIKMAVIAAQWLVPLSPPTIAAAVAFALVVTVAPGGMRSQAWSCAAQALAVLVAVLVPACIAAVMETNLPFGQFSHGPVMRAVGRLEAEHGVPIPVAGLLGFYFPEAGAQPILGRFTTAFGSIGPLAFVLATLSVLMGIAGSPVLLARAVTTPTVYDTRKSIGWAVALVGVLVMTLSSIAVFERDVLLTHFAGQSLATAPRALQHLVDLGIATVDARSQRIAMGALNFDRDGMLVALPVLMGMPKVVVSLVAAGVLSAALAGAAASLAQLGIIIGEDVVNGPGAWRASDGMRLGVCRVAFAAAAALAGVVAVAASGDPLALLLHALTISGSALFPVLVLSVWWKRTNGPGAMAGMASGFLVALAIMLLAGMAGIGIPPAIAPALAVPVAVAATLVVSQLTPAPGRHILEVVRDLRIPGGETIHDRELRQARQREQRSA